MEKINLEEFRRIKAQIADLVARVEALEEREDITEEEEEKINTEFDDLVISLKNYDLSDIPFEEYEGFYDIGFDFEGTGANLDYSIINTEYRSGAISRLKGCNVRNFDFDSMQYDDDSFDQDFVDEHSEMFLTSLIKNTRARHRYYTGSLDYPDLLVIANTEGIEKISDYIQGADRCIGHKKIPGLIRKFGIDVFSKLDFSGIDNLETFNGYQEIARALIDSDLTADSPKEDFDKIVADEMLNEFSRRSYAYAETYKVVTQSEVFKKYHPEYIIDFGDNEILKNDFFNGELTLNALIDNKEKFNGKKYVSKLKIGKYRDLGVTEDQIDYFINNFPGIAETFARVSSDFIDLTKLIDSTKPVEENRKQLVGYINELPINDSETFVALSEVVPIETLLNKVPLQYGKDDLIDLLKYATPEQFLEYFHDGEDLFGTYNDVCGKISFAKTYSIPTILEFERQNGELVTNGNIRGYNQLYESYLHYAANDHDPRTNVLTREIKENESYDRPYTQEEMYESIRRMILSNGFKKNVLNYENIKGPFREKFPELFLPENVPDELKTKFYTKTMSYDDIAKYKDYLNDVEIRAGLANDLSVNNDYNYYTLVDYLEINGYGNEDIISFIENNKGELEFYSKNINSINDIKISSVPKEQIIDLLVEEIHKKVSEQIKENRYPYTEDFSQKFKDTYPELFLSANVPEEIKRAFYNRKLTCELIQEHPEVIDELSEKSFSYLIPGAVKQAFQYRDTAHSVAQSFPDIVARLATKDERWYEKDNYAERLSNEIILHFANKYGEYATEVFKLMDQSVVRELSDETFEKFLEDNIVSGNILYGPDLPDSIKAHHPEMFLDENAPEELKLAFYSSYVSKDEKYKDHSSTNYVMTLDLLRRHPEYLEFLQGKNLSVSSRDESFRNMALTFNINEIYELVSKDVESVSLIGAASLEKTEKLKRFLNEMPEYFAKRELIKIDGYTEEEIQQAIENGTNEELLSKLQNKERKFRDKIISTPGLILYYPEAEIGKFDFGEYKNLLELSHFTASQNYRRGTAEQIVSTMYGFLGYSEAKDLMKLPNLSEEEYAEICAQNAEKYNQIYEERYYISGNLKTTNALFNKLVPAVSNRKLLMNVFRSINTKITEGYDGNVEDFINEILKENSVELPVDKINAIALNVVLTNTQNKLSMVSDNIYSSINEVVAETDENKKILYDTAVLALKKTLMQYDKVDMGTIRELIHKEFEKTNQDGTTFYSPHVTSHESEIIDIIDKLRTHEKYGRILNNSVIDILSEEQSKIGKGWIRKLSSVPESVSLQELEELENLLYGETANIGIDTVKRIELRDTSEQTKQAVYELLSEIDSKGLLTYEKGEKMFAGFPYPYSDKFREFFIKNKDEIIRDPKYYSKVIDMATTFDEFVNHPMRVNRYESGHMTLDEVIDNLGKASYGGKEDEYELELRAKQAGLPKQHFPFAQKIFTQMRQRESQTVPPEQARKGRLVGRIVRMDDPIAIFAGNITSCCQKLGEGQPGEPSMIHSAIERNGSMFIVEEVDEFGNTVRPVAQSWTWRNGNRVCFDNVEIPDAIEEELKQSRMHDEILEVYKKTAERMVETDRIKMQKLLEKGKITQKQYDDIVLSEVTFGTGCDDLYRNLSPELKKSLPTTSIVSPVEKEQKYTGMHTASPWIDSSATQILLAKSESNREFTEDTKLSDIPIEYGKVRNIVRYEDYDINAGVMREIAGINEAEGRCDFINSSDVSERDYKKIAVAMSDDKDWYMAYIEKDDSIEVIDSVVAKADRSTEEILTSFLESTRELFMIMQTASSKGKSVIIKPEEFEGNIAVNKLIESGVITNEAGKLKVENEEEFEKCVDALDKKLDTDKRKSLQEIEER